MLQHLDVSLVPRSGSGRLDGPSLMVALPFCKHGIAGGRKVSKPAAAALCSRADDVLASPWRLQFAGTWRCPRCGTRGTLRRRGSTPRRRWSKVAVIGRQLPTCSDRCCRSPTDRSRHSAGPPAGVGLPGRDCRSGDDGVESLDDSNGSPRAIDAYAVVNESSWVAQSGEKLTS
jgi:hypothetical protein